MLQGLAGLIAEGQQLVTPAELKNASRDLYGSEDPVRPLLDRLDSVTVALRGMMDEADAVKSQAVEEDAIQITTTRAVHAARPSGPTLSLEARQPTAGGDFELDVSFTGLGSVPEATWFKNGRPWAVRPPWRVRKDGRGRERVCEAVHVFCMNVSPLESLLRTPFGFYRSI